MATKKKVNIELEAAKAVIAAHYAAEVQQRIAEHRPLIGKFFRHRNSYGGDRKKWWLYIAVTGVDDGGVPTGWTFQHTSGDVVQIERVTWLSGVPHNGYQAISARSFWREAAALRVLLIDQLSDSA